MYIYARLYIHGFKQLPEQALRARRARLREPDRRAVLAFEIAHAAERLHRLRAQVPAGDDVSIELCTRVRIYR